MRLLGIDKHQTPHASVRLSSCRSAHQNALRLKRRRLCEKIIAIFISTFIIFCHCSGADLLISLHISFVCVHPSRRNGWLACLLPTFLDWSIFKHPPFVFHVFDLVGPSGHHPFRVEWNVVDIVPGIIVVLLLEIKIIMFNSDLLSDLLD